MEQSPAPLLCNHGHTDRGHRERCTDKDSVEHDNCDVRGPSPSAGHRSIAPGHERFPGRQENEDHDERP